MLQNGTLDTWNLEINCLDLIPGSTSCYHVNLHKLLHLFVYLFPHLQIFKALLIYHFIKAETPILWPPDAKSWLIWKDHDARKDWPWEEKGITEDEMVGWHHQLNGEFGWTLGIGDGQGCLACCSPWGRIVRHDWATELNWICHFGYWKD